jgi:hypothetical protein
LLSSLAKKLIKLKEKYNYLDVQLADNLYILLGGRERYIYGIAFFITLTLSLIMLSIIVDILIFKKLYFIFLVTPLYLIVLLYEDAIHVIILESYSWGKQLKEGIKVTQITSIKIKGQIKGRVKVMNGLDYYRIVEVFCKSIGSFEENTELYVRITGLRWPVVVPKHLIKECTFYLTGKYIKNYNNFFDKPPNSSFDYEKFMTIDEYYSALYGFTTWHYCHVKQAKYGLQILMLIRLSVSCIEILIERISLS